MTTATQQRPVLQPLLSARTHVAAVLGVAAVVALAWAGAGQQSHHAVENAQVAMAPVTYVTLPTVAIVAPRTVKVSAIPARRVVL